MLPGPIGMISSGVATAGELAQGHWRQAAIASIGLLGVGAAAKIGSKVLPRVLGTAIPRIIEEGPSAAKNVRQSLAIVEASQRTGTHIMKSQPLNDPRIIGVLFKKMKYVHGDITVHYLQSRVLPFVKRQYKIKR